MLQKMRRNMAIAFAVVFGILIIVISIVIAILLVERKSPMEEYATYVLTGIACLLLVISAISFYFLLLRPFHQIENTLKQLDVFTQGDESKNLNDSESIVLSIQTILEERRIADEKIHQEAMARQRLQYEQLQNQINPHFLYNTLETIRGQAIIDNNYLIADMTETLAKYFRYNISKNKDDVTIEQELSNIENYIKIQSYRFQNRFVFRVCPHAPYEEYAYCMIPKMILQPFVENAIFHGIEPKLELGHIFLHITTTDDKLTIQISDDGVGMEEETLKALSAMLMSSELEAAEEMDQANAHGIAMKNVNKRLQLLYGEDYGIRISSKKDFGTEVTITIPKIYSRK